MNHEVVVFGGGCFWCTEAVFQDLKGVISVMPGYAGGTTLHPDYYSVNTGETGHAEVLQITFDPSIISFTDLLTVFFATHDPTTLNRQGADVGTQYRSLVLYTTEKQRRETEMFIEKLNEDGERVVTEVKKLVQFYPAEAEHLNFYKNNTDAPYCQVVINPKLKKLKERFNQLLKPTSNAS